MHGGMNSVRRATLADIPAGVALLRKMYPERGVGDAEDYARWLLSNENRLVLIGSHSLGCAQFTWKYGFEPRARLDFLAAEPAAHDILEPLQIVRMMLAWARQKGAKGTFILDADTGVDFGPFAKRLGGHERVMRRWEIPLE